MYVDGQRRTVAPSSQPIGYSITRADGRRDLPAGQRPDLRGMRRPVSARAGIIVTGTEVLTGRVSDRNGPWLAERLRELGVDLAYHDDRRRPPAGHARRAALHGRARALT